MGPNLRRSSRTRRGVAVLPIIAGAALSLAIATPVAADKPARGCASDAALMTFDEFRQTSIDAGVPEQLLDDAWAAGLATFDRNLDGLVCVKDVPDTNGHLGSWVFNITDNTSNH